MRYLEEIFCFQRKDVLRPDNNLRIKRRQMVLADEDRNTGFIENAIHNRFHKEDEKRSLELSVIIKTEGIINSIAYNKNFTSPYNDNALKLILLTTNWKNRDIPQGTLTVVKKKLGIVTKRLDKVPVEGKRNIKPTYSYKGDNYNNRMRKKELLSTLPKAEKKEKVELKKKETPYSLWCLSMGIEKKKEKETSYSLWCKSVGF